MTGGGGDGNFEKFQKGGGETPKGGGETFRGRGDCIFQPKFQNSVIVRFQNSSNITKCENDQLYVFIARYKVNSPVFYGFEKNKFFHFVVLLSNMKIYNEIRGGGRIFFRGEVTNIFSRGGGGYSIIVGTQTLGGGVQPLFTLCV